MDFYIPKHKEIYIRDGEIATTSRLKGEYRAKMYGADGRLKLDTDWQPNLLLDTGLTNFHRTYISGGIWAEMRLGDSDVPVDITQNSLQGTYLGKQSSTAIVGTVNGGVPDYEHIHTQSHTFLAGNVIDLIKEFTLGPYNVPTVQSARVVLATPINKGAADQLVIEHRLTFYPETADISGQILIDTEAYNYTMRPSYIAVMRSNRISTCAMGASNGNGQRALDCPLVAVTAIPNTNWKGSFVRVANTEGGVSPNYYNDLEIASYASSWDNPPQSVSMIHLGLGGSYSTTASGTQCHIGKVSDGTPFIKEKTHEWHMFFRSYALRYVP